MKKPARRGPARAFEQRTAADAIVAALAFRGISDEIRAQRVIAEWSDLVGPRIAARTRPDGVVARTLVIEVASSAWLHELNLLRAQILAGLVDRLGEPRLFDKLELRLAGRQRRDAVVVPRPHARPAPPARPTPHPAAGAAREQILKDSERVDDAELRELIARIRIANDR